MDKLQIKTVFDKLQDDESRMIFMHLLQFYLDGDYNNLFNMVDNLKAFYDIDAKKPILGTKNRVSELINIYKNNPKPVVLYGAGECAPIVIHYLTKNEIKIDCFCDSNSNLAGTMKYGYHIISPEQLIRDYQGAYIVMATTPMYLDEIYKFLIHLGFNKNQVFGLHSWAVGDLQYFGLEAVNPVDDEIFIDAGCLNGFTISQFVTFCNGNYKKIYGMEPDPGNYRKTCEFIQEKGYKDVKIVDKGAWSSEDTLYFNNTSNGASKLDESGKIEVPVTSIDSMLNGDATTFIKMDIEGAELEALKGAENTIRKYHPKLAICIYHRPEDILTIPCYINKLVPDYKFYIRHHSSGFSETVLYAIPEHID